MDNRQQQRTPELSVGHGPSSSRGSRGLPFFPKPFEFGTNGCRASEANAITSLDDMGPSSFASSSDASRPQE